MFKKDNDPWVRTFSVSNPIRHKKGYTLYKVVSKVFPKNSIEAVTQVTVWKRYNDFKNFHKTLHTIHQSLYLQGIFPPFAKARFFGRFDDEVVEERRKCALELLEFCSKHSPLFTSQVFVKFFESSHIVDVLEEPEEICHEPVLLPTVTNAQPASSDDSDQNGEPENSESTAPLGGIWQHHQDCDEISITSLNNSEEDEEDDRTTFTDEDLTVSKPILDLSEFDPVLTTSVSASEKSQDICNDWLLSAFQSCGVTPEKPDSDCTMTFPKPFENHIFEHKIKVEEPVSVFEEISYHADSPKPDLGVVIDEFDPLNSCTNEQSSDSCTLEFGEDSLNTIASTPAYILSAGKCIAAAYEAESSMNHLDAFTFYKTAVDVLLHGVQDEKDEKQNETVRHKILAYLKRAEELYEDYLSQDKECEENKIEAVVTEAIPDKRNDLFLHRPMSDLGKYRVIGILSRVLLVLNTLTNTTCVVKVLRKNPYPHLQDNPNIAPQGINFMVQLYEVYETVDAIFLILEYASGGCLWDYISSYLQRSPLTATEYDEEFLKTESQDNRCNVYSGKKLHCDISEIPSSDATEIPVTVHSPEDLNTDLDLVASDECPSSYLSLFKNYMIATEKRNTISLAKCNVRLSGLRDVDDVNLIGIDSTNQENLSSETENHFKEILNSKLQKDFEFSKDSERENIVSIPIANNNVNLVEDLVNVPSKDSVRPPECLDAQSVTDNAPDVNKGNSGTALVSSGVSEKCSHVGSNSGEDFPGQGYEKDDLCSKPRHVSLAHGLSQSTNGASQPKGFCMTEAFKQMDDAVSIAAVKPLHLPESCVILWAAEIVTALHALHKLGITWRDLNPENILLGSEGHILLTYASCWNSVHHLPSQNAKRDLYSAPEVKSVFPVTTACDWWSLGAILFELITGQKLVFCYPIGITSHTTLSFPADVSVEASDLLQKLLVHNASERLGSGPHGVEDIKSHPFFRSIEWKSLRGC